MNEFKVRFTILDYSCTDDSKIEDTLGDARKRTEAFFRLFGLEFDRYIFPHFLDETYEMRDLKSFGYGFHVSRNLRKADSVFYIRMMIEGFAGLLRQSGLEVDVDSPEKNP